MSVIESDFDTMGLGDCAKHYFEGRNLEDDLRKQIAQLNDKLQTVCQTNDRVEKVIANRLAGNAVQWGNKLLISIKSAAYSDYYLQETILVQ